MFTKSEQKLYFKSKLPIWSIWIDEVKAQIILEHRDQNPAPSLTVLSLEGAVIFENRSSLLPHLVNIATIHDSKILYKYYIDQHNPLQMGFGVYDLNTENLIWEKGGHSFYAFDPHSSIIACYPNQLEGIQKQFLDFNTGDTSPSFDQEKSLINYPSSYTKGTAYHQQVNSFLKTHGYDTNESIDYIELEHMLLIGMHQEGNLEILMCTISGELIDKILIEGQNQSSYHLLTIKNSLIIIKNKIELLSYGLKCNF